VALAAVAGFATGFFRPALYAGMPNVVDERDLADANSIFQTLENVTTAVAPVLGGIVVAAYGTHVAYWVNAASFLFSAVILARISAQSFESPREAPEGGHFRELRAGYALVLHTRELLGVLVAWTILGVIANAGVNVAEVQLAKRSYNAGDFGFGLMVTAAGVGMAIGAYLVARQLRRLGIARVYGLSIGLMALGIAGAAAAPDVWVGALCVVVAGIGNGAAVVCNITLVQRGAPDRLRGRVFTILMSSSWTFLAVGMIGAGAATDAFGARWVWGAAAIVSAIAAVTAYVLTRGLPDVDDGGELPRVVPSSPEEDLIGLTVSR
jgi:MFS family permease